MTPRRARETFGLSAWTGRPGLMALGHHHAEVELNLLRGGGMTYWVSGRHERVPAGRLAVIWGGLPHQLIAVEASVTACDWATIPLARFLSMDLPESFTSRLLRSGLLVDSGSEALDDGLMARWREDLTRGDPGWSSLVLREIDVRLSRMAMRLRPASSRTTETLDAVDRMARFIAEHLDQPIGISQIAAEASLSPGYAMTLFKRQTGVTLHAYLTQQRVAAAMRCLAESEESVYDVAANCGFGSMSRFFDAFKARTGQTPRAYRESVRQR